MIGEMEEENSIILLDWLHTYVVRRSHIQVSLAVANMETTSARRFTTHPTTLSLHCYSIALVPEAAHSRLRWPSRPLRRAPLCPLHDLLPNCVLMRRGLSKLIFRPSHLDFTATRRARGLILQQRAAAPKHDCLSLFLALAHPACTI